MGLWNILEQTMHPQLQEPVRTYDDGEQHAREQGS